MRATRVRGSPRIVLNTKHSTKDIGIGKTFLRLLRLRGRYNPNYNTIILSDIVLSNDVIYPTSFTYFHTLIRLCISIYVWKLEFMDRVQYKV